MKRILATVLLLVMSLGVTLPGLARRGRRGL